MGRSNRSFQMSCLSLRNSFMQLANHFEGIYQIYLVLTKENREISTCKPAELGNTWISTNRFPQNLPRKLSQNVESDSSKTQICEYGIINSSEKEVLTAEWEEGRPPDLIISFQLNPLPDNAAAKGFTSCPSVLAATAETRTCAHQIAHILLSIINNCCSIWGH